MPDPAEIERQEVDELIEAAAKSMVVDDSLTATSFVDGICTLHPDWAPEIVGVRIVIRRDELLMHVRAAAARYEQDLVDRAVAVVAGEQHIGDAAWAIAVAYPLKMQTEILDRLADTVRRLRTQEA